jgi:hypothetical protein
MVLHEHLDQLRDNDPKVLSQSLTGRASTSLGPWRGFRAPMAKREPQIILKTDERKLVLELGLGGKFTARSTAWDENRVFLEGDKLEVTVNSGRWVLTALPAKPPEPKPVQHYFPED